jgi:hypothetical protein
MNEPRRKFEEPEVVTYCRDELVAEIVFTGEPSNPGGSNRNLKQGFRNTDVKDTLGRLIRIRKPLEKPEVVTYSHDDLMVATVFTGDPSQRSNRNLKRGFRKVDSRITLDRLVRIRKPFEKPEVVTYDREDLLGSSVFTGRPPSQTPCDLRLKRGFRFVGASNSLARLIRTL